MFCIQKPIKCRRKTSIYIVHDLQPFLSKLLSFSITYGCLSFPTVTSFTLLARHSFVMLPLLRITFALNFCLMAVALPNPTETHAKSEPVVSGTATNGLGRREYRTDEPWTDTMVRCSCTMESTIHDSITSVIEWNVEVCGENFRHILCATAATNTDSSTIPQPTTSSPGLSLSSAPKPTPYPTPSPTQNLNQSSSVLSGSFASGKLYYSDFTNSTFTNTSSTPSESLPTGDRQETLEEMQGKHNSGHRGLLYQNGTELMSFSKHDSSKVSWAFNKQAAPYAVSSDGGYPDLIEYVPMLATAKDKDVATWQKLLSHAVALYGSKAVMAFNEPDNCSSGGGGGSGSCLTVPKAVDAYLTHMNPNAISRAEIVQYGAPTVTSAQGDGVGLSWLREFMIQCTRCRIDFVPIQWSGSGGDVAGFKSYIGQAATAAQGKPLWVTGLTVHGGSAAQFLNQVADFLDTDPRVQRWAWPTLGTDSTADLIDRGSNKLTQLGKFFDGNNRS